MGRRPIHSMKPRKEPILDHYVQASVEQGMNDAGHYGELVYAGVEDQLRAVEIRRSLFRSAKHLGVSLKADVEQAADGTHQVRFHAIDKAVARAHMVQTYRGREHEMPYNPYAPRGGAA